MKIKITRESLLRQLPEPLPKEIILDGTPCNPPKDSIREKYPEVFETLTKTEWELFSELDAKEEMTKIEFAKHFRTNDGFLDNHIAVYVYTMNKRFKKHKLPFEIVGKRGFGLWRLIRK